MADGSSRNSGEVMSMEGMDLLRVTSYGPLEKPADLVLLAQHGGQSRDLGKRLNGSVVDQPGVYEDFLRIDRDAGTPELAHAVANEVVKITGDLRVNVVEVLYERGILDPNRIAGLAIRNFLKLDNNRELSELMMRMHALTAQVCNANLAEILGSNGFFVDVHSMAPYDPLGLGEEEPGTLLSYNDAYSNRAKRGARRSLDLITDIPGERLIAHPVLVKNMLRGFENGNVPTKSNDPYPKKGMPVRNIMSARYMLAFPGVALDLPKDYMSRGEAESISWNIADLQMDFNKVEMLAEIVATAIVRSLLEIRS